MTFFFTLTVYCLTTRVHHNFNVNILFFLIMSNYQFKATVEVSVERLDVETVDDELASTAMVLHEIMSTSASGQGEVCPHCGKLYKTASTLQSHCQLKHPTPVTSASTEVQCPVCGKTYSSLLSLHKHSRYMHRYEYKCRACYRNFATRLELKDHTTSCVRTETPCGICGRVYGSQIALKNHMKYMHPGESSHWCSICRRAFTNERGLANHMTGIHPENATTCAWCGRVFSSRPALQSHVVGKHIKSGTGGASAAVKHICGLCNRKFLRTAELVQHALREHASK